MTDLIEFLFPAPVRHRSFGSIAAWWERRRLRYNALVGATGVVSLGIVFVVMALPPYGELMPFIPLGPILVFGLMANVCYLLGPLAEWLLMRLCGDRLLPVGPMLYRMGLTFSMGLAALPALIVSFGWVARILKWVI